MYIIVKKHPKASRFVNGWHLYTDIQSLMPSNAKGGNVYRPSMSTPRAPLLSSESSNQGSSNSSNNATTIAPIPSPQLDSLIPLPPDEPISPPLDKPVMPRSPGLEDPIPLTAPSPPTSPVVPSAPSISRGKGKQPASQKRKNSPNLSPSDASPSLSSLSVSSSFGDSGELERGLKRTRVSGPVAINGLKEELTVMNATYRMSTEHKIRRSEERQAAAKAAAKAAALTDPVPEAQIRKTARELVETHETYLSDESMIAIFDIFNKEDVTLAETYVGIKRGTLRRLWIKKLLKEHCHIPDFDSAIDNATGSMM